MADDDMTLVSQQLPLVPGVKFPIGSSGRWWSLGRFYCSRQALFVAGGDCGGASVSGSVCRWAGFTYSVSWPGKCEWKLRNFLRRPFCCCFFFFDCSVTRSAYYQCCSS